MKIHRPIKSNWLTQVFNENIAYAKLGEDGYPIRPFIIKGSQSGRTPNGYIPFYHALGMKGHNGWDHACWIGEPIYFPVDAPCEWWVRNYVDNDGGMGIDVFSDRPIDIGELPKETGELAKQQYNGMYSKYDEKGKVYVKFRFHHISKSLIKDSENNIPNKPEGYRDTKVVLGTPIALGGNTGASSGAHLHWSLKIVANNSMTLDSDNGYFGAVDFKRYYIDKFVIDLLDELTEQVLTLTQVVKKLVFDVSMFISNLTK